MKITSKKYWKSGDLAKEEKVISMKKFLGSTGSEWVITSNFDNKSLKFVEIRKIYEENLSKKMNSWIRSGEREKNEQARGNLYVFIPFLSLL